MMLLSRGALAAMVVVTAAAPTAMEAVVAAAVAVRWSHRRRAPCRRALSGSHREGLLPRSLDLAPGATPTVGVTVDVARREGARRRRTIFTIQLGGRGNGLAMPTPRP